MVPSVRQNFFKLKQCNIVVCLLAIVAMFASAVSACACTHHEMRAGVEQAPSCHSASHEGSAAPVEPAVSDNFRSGCGCFVTTPVLAIAAKSESKRFSAEKAVAAGETLLFELPLLLFSNTDPVDFDTNDLAYSWACLNSGSPRAPPRL